MCKDGACLGIRWLSKTCFGAKKMFAKNVLDPRPKNQSWSTTSWSRPPTKHCTKFRKKALGGPTQNVAGLQRKPAPKEIRGLHLWGLPASNKMAATSLLHSFFYTNWRFGAPKKQDTHLRIFKAVICIMSMLHVRHTFCFTHDTLWKECFHHLLLLVPIFSCLEHLHKSYKWLKTLILVVPASNDGLWPFQPVNIQLWTKGLMVKM